MIEFIDLCYNVYYIFIIFSYLMYIYHYFFMYVYANVTDISISFARMLDPHCVHIEHYFITISLLACLPSHLGNKHVHQDRAAHITVDSFIINVKEII